jgi:membrane-bound lytic murein transglycosylase B
MNYMANNLLLRCSVVLIAASLAACASSPAEDPATAPAPAAQPAAAAAKPAATPEAVSETVAATALEKKFQEAARSYRVMERDGKTMYCKKEKPINSTIPRLQCITEAQLRLQVEQMDELRDRMRNSGRCTQGAGCGGGG